MAELRRHLGPVARIPEDKVDRVILQMQAAFPGAMTPVWPSDRVAALTNQPKDRHVLAVAIEAEARFIVTQNLKDFRPADLDPHGIEALSADDFLLYLLHNRTRRLVNVIRGMSARLTRPPLTPIELVRALQTQAPAFAERAIIELAK